MERIPQETIEEILQLTDITEIISGFVQLKKSGGGYTGLCPFHNEKSPSFNVSPSKRIFKCFGCGVGGNVITFLMKIQNRAFPQVVRELGDRVGVDVQGQERTELGLFLKMHELAMEMFISNLSRNEKAREYLNERGIEETTIRKYGIGYAPDSWDSLLKYLRSRLQDLTPEVLEQSGLFTRSEKGRVYDRFRDRIMFPIRDLNSRCIAFGGRILYEGKPKYLNSPESKIFDKGSVLYNLDRASKLDEDWAIVVEGYMDAIALSQAGFLNVVAPLGTGFTQKHVSLIEKNFRKVILVFDGDEAGSVATLRALERFIDSSLVVKAVRLKDGMDPQEYIEQEGAADFALLLKNAPIALKFYCEDVIARHPLNERSTKVEAYKKLRAFFQNLDQVMLIGDEVNEPDLVQFLSEKFEVEEAVIRKEFFPAKSVSAKPVTSFVRQYSPHLDMGMNLMIFALKQKNLRELLLKEINRSSFEEGMSRDFYDYLQDGEILSLEELMSEAGDELGAFISGLQWNNDFNARKEEGEYRLMLREFKIQTVQKKLLMVSEEFSRPELSKERKAHLEMEKVRLLKERNRILQEH